MKTLITVPNEKTLKLLFEQCPSLKNVPKSKIKIDTKFPSDKCYIEATITTKNTIQLKAQLNESP